MAERGRRTADNVESATDLLLQVLQTSSAMNAKGFDSLW